MFIYDEDKGKTIVRHSYKLYSREEGAGIVSYTTDRTGNNFQIADGQPRKLKIRGVDATLMYRCENDSLVIEVQVIGSKSVNRKKLVIINDRELRIESNQPEVNGIYVKG
jgi:hypothetical protein